jgi:hypothetical protein
MKRLAAIKAAIRFATWRLRHYGWASIIIIAFYMGAIHLFGVPYEQPESKQAEGPPRDLADILSKVSKDTLESLVRKLSELPLVPATVPEHPGRKLA